MCVFFNNIWTKLKGIWTKQPKNEPEIEIMRYKLKVIYLFDYSASQESDDSIGDLRRNVVIQYRLTR